MAAPIDSALTVHDRLVQAADAALRVGDLSTVTIDSVAEAAGVSRATAFRQLGKHDDMVVAVGLLRSIDYAQACEAAMADKATALDQIEAAFSFLVRTLPDDPVMRALVGVRAVADLTDDVHDLTAATFGAPIERGRIGGEIRDDVPIEQVMQWVVEQLYLAIQQSDRGSVAVRDRLQLFLFPALRPKVSVDATARTLQERMQEASRALEAAVRAVTAIRSEVR